MTAKFLENIEYFSQRDNLYSPSVACLPTSAAIALNYIHKIKLDNNMQLEDFILKETMNLTNKEKELITATGEGWVFEEKNGELVYDPWKCLPIMEFVCNKLYPPCELGWAISFDTIKENIDDNTPVVCLGNFRSLSRVSGHYNCIIGYDDDDETNEGKKFVWTCDPWGNAYENYKVNDGHNMYYDWEIFNRGNGKSSGLLF